MIKQLKQSEIKILREKILQEQNNICPITNKTILNPVLDHEHKKRLGGTGLIRSVIDRTTNIFLGKIENNCKRYGISLKELPNILRNIADYLENDYYKCDENHYYIHPSEKEKQQKIKKSCYNNLKKKYLKSSIKRKFPEYTGNLSKNLERFFKELDVEIEFY